MTTKCKIIVDTNVYIDLFNRGLHRDIVNPFKSIQYLAYPVLHELWMGLKDRREERSLTVWRDRFIKLKRFVVPSVATLVLIGEAYRLIGLAGKLDPVHPKHYNDICIAALAHQIGAVVKTKNREDFNPIHSVIDFDFDDV